MMSKFNLISFTETDIESDRYTQGISGGMKIQIVHLKIQYQVRSVIKFLQKII